MSDEVTNPFQPFPSTGILAQNRNTDLSSIKRLYPKDDATVYYYVIATILNKEGDFFQTGSAPNFQGGFISLCTCKHYMRTFLKPDQWIGKWVAGFSGLRAGNGRNALVFLMRVAYTYPSHAGIWSSKELPEGTKQAKAAHNDKFGDLFEPLSDWIDEYDPNHYKNPSTDHVHHKGSNWYNDINYISRYGHRPALLYGEPENSYFWDKPTIFLPISIGIGQRKTQLSMLLSHMESDKT